MQGDERDVILFSLAFSTNPETGKLPLNFGPLTQTGGERRLNVAITRARRQVVLFASFDPSDIDLARTAAVGTRHLRAYCELAASGADRLGDLSSTRRQRRDRIREEVADAIRARGHEVIIGHGLSDFTVDIAVRVPGAPRWQVAVILDGPQWSARPTVADRDSAPPLLRGIMGWPEMIRFWLPAWIRERAAILDRVDAAVQRAVDAEAQAAADREATAAAEAQAAAEAAQEEAPAAADQPASPEHNAPEANPPAAQAEQPVDEPSTGEQVPHSQVVVAERPAETPAPVRQHAPLAEVSDGPTPFRPYEPTLVGDTTDLDVIRSSARVQAAVRAVLGEVIATEGPVEQHRLARLTLKCFGLHKTSTDRRASVLALVDPGALRVHPIGTFAWPSTMDPETWRGFRRGSDRDFEEVVPEEIVNAVCHALAVPGLSERDLLRATLELLGYRRMTEKIENRLRYGLEFGQDRGRLVHDRDGRYRLGSTV